MSSLADLRRLLGPDGGRTPELLALVTAEERDHLPAREERALRKGLSGVVTDPAARLEALEGVLSAAQEAGLSVLGLAPSPIVGGEGNHEYLVHLARGGVGESWQALRVMAHNLVHEEER